MLTAQSRIFQRNRKTAESQLMLWGYSHLNFIYNAFRTAVEIGGEVWAV